MTQASSLQSLPAMDAGRPLTMAALADMGLTTDASLLALNDAACHGADIVWEDDRVAIGPLARLPRASLEVLLELRREFAHVRQNKGYADAKANGVNVGRHVKELPPQFEEQAQFFIAGKISCRQAAAACGMPPLPLSDAPVVNAVLPPRVADACRCWASRGLTKKEAAAEAGLSLSMFDRALAAHGVTRISREQHFAAACAKWEAGRISKQAAVRESKISGTEFNALLRKAGKPLHFDGEKPHWLDVLESGSLDAVLQRWAGGELTTAKTAAAACGLSQRNFKLALQHMASLLRAERAWGCPCRGNMRWSERRGSPARMRNRSAGRRAARLLLPRGRGKSGTRLPSRRLPGRRVQGYCGQCAAATGRLPCLAQAGRHPVRAAGDAPCGRFRAGRGSAGAARAPGRACPARQRGQARAQRGFPLPAPECRGCGGHRQISAGLHRAQGPRGLPAADCSGRARRAARRSPAGGLCRGPRRVAGRPRELP